MIIMNDRALKLKNKLKDNFYVVSDFDRTLTLFDSISTWELLSNSRFVHDNYNEEAKKYYDYYRPYEYDLSIPFEKRNKLMVEWWQKHLELFVKYKIKEEAFKIDNVDNYGLNFRKGAKEFLKYLYDHDIPLVIISAGIGNFIEQFLKLNGCFYDNIYILSNYIEFENGIACGTSQNIIHSLNKNELSFDEDLKEAVKGKNYVVLFGDQVDDVKMVSLDKRNETLRFGFLTNEQLLDDFKNNFDVIADKNTDYNEILEKLFI